MYVQSEGTQARIQQELSQRLGTTLSIKRISVTPWFGLKLTGITIPQSQAGVSPDFLTAKTFRLRIRFSSLFAQRLVIKEISLIEPDVVWAQNADGKWRLPSLPPEPVANVPPPQTQAALSPVPATVTLERSPEGTPPSTLPETAAVLAETETTPGFRPEIERVNLVGGRFLFLDEKLKKV